jgi:cyclic pyranopterin phosphate synthase
MVSAAGPVRFNASGLKNVALFREPGVLECIMEALRDRFGRRIEYLRISLTDRCNMRCYYCMPNGSPDFVKSQELLEAEEIGLVVGAMADRGLRKVRLTGGEPLLRQDIVDVAQAISATPGIQDLALSTNGLLLKNRAAALVAAGVRRANISLDSLDPIKFARVTGSPFQSRVLAGIDAALAAGMNPVKINIVALPDLDLADMSAFLYWAQRHGLHLRFIEEMPFGAADLQGPSNARLRHLIEALAGPLEPLPHNPLTDLVPPCRIPGETWTITFISPMTGPFCSACNRVRLTARGFLKLCLDEDLGIDLSEPLRSGARREDISELISQTIYRDKPERHHFVDLEFDRRGRIMARIGG